MDDQLENKNGVGPTYWSSVLSTNPQHLAPNKRPPLQSQTQNESKHTCAKIFQSFSTFVCKMLFLIFIKMTTV